MNKVERWRMEDEGKFDISSYNNQIFTKITLDDQSLAVIIDQNILISIFQQIFIHSIRIFSYIRKKIQTSDWINNIFFFKYLK